MNQDERRAKAVIDSGEVRQALERAFPRGVVEVLMEWAVYGASMTAHRPPEVR